MQVSKIKRTRSIDSSCDSHVLTARLNAAIFDTFNSCWCGFTDDRVCLNLVLASFLTSSIQ